MIQIQVHISWHCWMPLSSANIFDEVHKREEESFLGDNTLPCYIREPKGTGFDRFPGWLLLESRLLRLDSY